MRKISREVLKRALDSDRDFTLINVLSAEAFEKEHIPGSHNVPHDDPALVRRAEEIAGDKDQEIVVYCASTDCDASPKAARMLEDAGFSKVRDYEGGMKDWNEAGYEVAHGRVRGGRPVSG